MTNLIHLIHGCEDNEILAAQTELPLTFRIDEGKEHNTRTIKSEFILRTGSHHGFGLNALFAHRLYQDLTAAGNTTERVKELQHSNLEVLTANPYNIGAIIACMPKGCDAARLLEFAFPGSSENQDFKKSDFYYFAKSNDEAKLKEKPTASLILLAEIFETLQKCNRIEANEKLQEKIDAITVRAELPA